MRLPETSILPELAAPHTIVTRIVPPCGLIPHPMLHTPSSHWPCIRGYEILSVIGSGGMGIVYKARHRELQRTVAIKMLRGATLSDPEFRSRFQSEAEAVAKLQHPNIIQVFEIGVVEAVGNETNPSPFISLEFVEGTSLELAHRPTAASTLRSRDARKAGRALFMPCIDWE